MNSWSLSENTQRNIKDTTNIFGDTIRISDSDGTDWILPCIDCFIRIKAVREDKKQCEIDNANKNVIIMDLVADSRS